MDPDGTNEVEVTDNPGYDADPAWSPGGTKIVFASNSFIYVMNSDGTNKVRLLDTNSTEPAWSPDGSQIAFNGNEEIYVVNNDGTNQTRLTSNPSSDIRPSWSPDGTKIIFTSDRNGNRKAT